MARMGAAEDNGQKNPVITELGELVIYTKVFMFEMLERYLTTAAGDDIGAVRERFLQLVTKCVTSFVIRYEQLLPLNVEHVHDPRQY